MQTAEIRFAAGHRQISDHQTSRSSAESLCGPAFGVDRVLLKLSAAHIAALFPTSYAPASRLIEPVTSTSKRRGGALTAGAGRVAESLGFLGRLGWASEPPPQRAKSANQNGFGAAQRLEQQPRPDALVLRARQGIAESVFRGNRYGIPGDRAAS